MRSKGAYHLVSSYKNIENSKVNTLKFVYGHSALKSMKYGIKYSRKLIDPSPIRINSENSSKSNHIDTH